MTLRKLFKACMLASAVAAGTCAGAQTFPSKPIRILVGYPAGGTSDLQIRAIQEPLQRFLGQPVLVENKVGASGAIATAQVARAAPDGYTLLLPTNIFVIGPNLIKNVGFDPLKEFAPISLTSISPMVLVTHSSVPAGSVREFIDYARKHPGTLEFGSAGASSFGRMATELFARRAGIEMLHVPYQGAAQTTQAIAQGDIKVLISTLTAPLVSFEKEGKVRFLGAATEVSSPLLPGVPLIADVLPGFKTEVWSGIVAPVGTPANVIARLQDAIAKSLALPEVRERYATIGLTPHSSSPKEFSDRLRTEYAEWGTVIREANIKAD
mgnify:CR=1 FL=1